jgi:hypothetical protein
LSVIPFDGMCFIFLKLKDLARARLSSQAPSLCSLVLGSSTGWPFQLLAVCPLVRPWTVLEEAPDRGSQFGPFLPVGVPVVRFLVLSLVCVPVLYEVFHHTSLSLLLMMQKSRFCRLVMLSVTEEMGAHGYTQETARWAWTLQRPFARLHIILIGSDPRLYPVLVPRGTGTS